jgi:hypothetical protein
MQQVELCPGATTGTNVKLLKYDDRMIREASIAQRFVDNSKILAMVGPIPVPWLWRVSVLNKSGQRWWLSSHCTGLIEGPYPPCFPTDEFRKYIYGPRIRKMEKLAVVYVNDDFVRAERSLCKRKKR